MSVKFITVSIEIMHDKELNNSQKFILAEIEQLSSLEKGCFANNKHFADLIGITRENVSRNINELVKKGYITTEIEAGSRNHTRTISLTKIVNPPYQNSKPPLLKRQETKENIQTNKQINKASSSKSLIELIKEFEEFYNKDMLNAFYLYWSETNGNGKELWKMQRTWDTKRRLNRWVKNNFNSKSPAPVAQGQTTTSTFKPNFK